MRREPSPLSDSVQLDYLAPAQDHRPHLRAAGARSARTQRRDIVLSVVMPAYNEESTVRAAVEHVLGASYPCDVELIVVDDGSTDGTADELATISDPRLRVHRHGRNFGKGAALMTGIALANGTHLLPFDADLEYSAFDIPRLLEPVIEGRCEVVYGTRLFGQNTVHPSFRYAVGNKAMTLVANLLFDSYISDLHTCMKLVPLELLRDLHLAETGFGLDTEITAKVLRHGHRPFEVPVSYFARSHSEGKKINWRDGVECLKVLGRVRVARGATVGTVASSPARLTWLRPELAAPPLADPRRVVVLPDGQVATGARQHAAGAAE